LGAAEDAAHQMRGTPPVAQRSLSDSGTGKTALCIDASGGDTMTRQEELSGQAAFCLRSAQTAKDPIYKLALLELAEWWATQADHARRLQTQSDPSSAPAIGGPARI